MFEALVLQSIAFAAAVAASLLPAFRRRFAVASPTTVGVDSSREVELVDRRPTADREVSSRARQAHVREYERLLDELRAIKANGRIDKLEYDQVVSQFSRGLLDDLLGSDRTVIDLRSAPSTGVAQPPTTERAGPALPLQRHPS